MNTAVADEVIDSNPCWIRGAASTPRAREIRPATIEELEVIVEAMPERLRALVLLCAWCALRSGEVLELRRRDLDVAAGTVRVVRALSWVGGEPIVGTPKSAAGTRVVSIPPHVVPAIAHHLDTMTAPGPEALLFPGRDGVSHLQPSTMHRHWRLARDAAGRPDLRVHDLRHTGATMAARAGADPGGAAGATRPQQRQCRPSISARRARPRPRDRGRPVRDGERLRPLAGLELKRTHMPMCVPANVPARVPKSWA